MGADIVDNRGLFAVTPDESGRGGNVRVASLLSKSDPATVITIEVNGEVVVLSSEMKKLMQAGAGMLAEGKQVTLAALDLELSTAKAAELLGISREYLRQLCEAGEVPFRMVGSHRRLTVADVLAYRAQRQAERKRKFGEMVKSAAAAGEYDLDITLEEASF